IKDSNYLVFMQASVALGQTYVRQGRVELGIRVLERARNGQSDKDIPAFETDTGYLQRASLPYLKVSFLEALGNAYEDANRSDDALRSWQELYDTAAAAGFTLAKAESAHKLADLYKAKKEFQKSIDHYAIAASAWGVAGNEQRRIEALTSEATLLFQQ